MSVDTPQLISDWSSEAWDSPSAQSQKSVPPTLSNRDKSLAGGDDSTGHDVAQHFKGYAIPFELEKLKDEDLEVSTGFFGDALS